MCSFLLSSVALPKSFLGRWHHACVSWTNNDQNSTKIYVEGGLWKKGSIHKPSFLTRKKERTIVVGGNAFVGELTDVNIWNYHVSSGFVRNLANSICDAPGNGNVLHWSGLSTNQIRGDVRMELLGCQSASSMYQIRITRYCNNNHMCNNHQTSPISS